MVVLPRLDFYAYRSLPASRCVSTRIAAGAATSRRRRRPASPPTSRPVSQHPTTSRTGVCSDLGAPQHLCVAAVTGTALCFTASLYCHPPSARHEQYRTIHTPHDSRAFYGCVFASSLSLSQPGERIFSKVELSKRQAKRHVSPKFLKPPILKNWHFQCHLVMDLYLWQL